MEQLSDENISNQVGKGIAKQAVTSDETQTIIDEKNRELIPKSEAIEFIDYPHVFFNHPGSSKLIEAINQLF